MSLDTISRRKIESALTLSAGRSAQIESASPVSGGCIHRALELRLADGSAVFAKIAGDGSLPADVFEREAEGLRALREPGLLKIPEVLAVARPDEHGPGFLILENIESGPKGSSFFRDFGRRLAELHRTATADTWGFEHDNYLGATAQPNGRQERWTDFWAEHRLGYQLELARRNGLSDAELSRLGERLLKRLPTLLDEIQDPPSLLHGDLWSGNFMVGAGGEPVLIDPAAYYGHREAELAMTRLFGGFPPDFYAAYEEAWPLEPGSSDRLVLYELYHLLNHLNLFGSGYRGQCIRALNRLT